MTFFKICTQDSESWFAEEFLQEASLQTALYGLTGCRGSEACGVCPARHLDFCSSCWF